MILPLMQSKCDPVRFDLFFVSHCMFLSVCSVRFCGHARFVFLRGLAARNLRSSFGEEVEAGELARELAWSSTEDLVNESREVCGFSQRNWPRSLPVCLTGRSQPDQLRSCFLPIFPFLSISICAAAKLAIAKQWKHGKKDARDKSGKIQRKDKSLKMYKMLYNSFCRLYCRYINRFVLEYARICLVL